MNVALTYRCNQRCRYCFGTDAMHLRPSRGKSPQMSVADLDRVLGFLRASSVSVFNMIGGEPTQHSEFEAFFRRIVAAGLSVQMFSNGVIDPGLVDFLAGQEKLVNILVNIRQPEEYRPQDWKRLLGTLRSLHRKVTLSFRVYRRVFRPVFLFDLIDRYGLQRLINWAIACPSLYRSNEFVPLEDHRLVVRKMAGYLRQSHDRAIRWYSDSGFIRCAFTERDLERFRRLVGFVPQTNCIAPVEVAPDLRVFRCFGMAVQTRPGLMLTDFRSLTEVEGYFRLRSLGLKRIGSFPECFRCEHMRSGVCCGGCMVHILRRMPGYQSLPPMF